MKDKWLEIRKRDQWTIQVQTPWEREMEKGIANLNKIDKVKALF